MLEMYQNESGHVYLYCTLTRMLVEIQSVGAPIQLKKTPEKKTLQPVARYHERSDDYGVLTGDAGINAALNRPYRSLTQEEL